MPGASRFFGKLGRQLCRSSLTAATLPSCQKFFRTLLKLNPGFFNFSVAAMRWRLGCLGPKAETGTGRVRCLISILLFGGFGYAHL